MKPSNKNKTWSSLLLIECYPAESGETYKAGETKATQFSDIKIEHNQLINNSFGGITAVSYTHLSVKKSVRYLKETNTYKVERGIKMPLF